MKELLKALSNVKAEIGKMSKDSDNPFFQSKYFDINQLLEHSEPILQKHGLLVLQPIIDGKVVTEIYHIETAEKLTSSLEIPNIPDPQKIGSAITYFRRYTLGSLLAIQAEDDDGNKASGNTSTSAVNSPEKWLNIANKQGVQTPEWTNVLQGIQSGKINSVADVRKHYKVNKDVASQLEQILKQKQNG